MDKRNRKNKNSKKIIPLILIIIILLFVVFILFRVNSSNASKDLDKNTTSDNEILNSTISSNATSDNINETEDIKEQEENNQMNQIENNNSNNIESNNGTQNNVTNIGNTGEQTNNISNSKNREFGSDVAFIGDSRTQAFLMYTGLKNVNDYTNIGLMVDTALTKKFITNNAGNKITILEDLQTKNVNTIYIMLGINELGWVYSSMFIKEYEKLIDRLQEVKPNCEIILESIIPVTKEKSDSDKIYNNNRIAEYNTLIKEMADRKNLKFIDLVPLLTDEDGNLPENASPDGIHLNKEYCLKWFEYLKNN